MGKSKELRKQMKKQFKKSEKRIEKFGEQMDVVDATTLKRAQECLVDLVDAMDAQLTFWQIAMTKVDIKTDGPNRNGNGAIPNPKLATATSTMAAMANTIWHSMEEKIQEWRATTATVRMEVGADVTRQMATLRALDTTAGEKLRVLKNEQQSAHDTLQATAEQALEDLKRALERIFPE